MKTTIQSVVWTTLFVCIALCAACGVDEETRRGGIGESCFVDIDCRGDALCVNNTCAGFLVLDSNNGTNGGSNSSGGSGSSDPGQTGSGGGSSTGGGSGPGGGGGGGSITGGSTSSDFTCNDVCSLLEACGFGIGSECSEECEEGTQDWTADEFDAFSLCLFSYECREINEGIEECFPFD